VREQVRVTRLLREATLDVRAVRGGCAARVPRSRLRPGRGMLAGDTSKLRDCLNQLLLNAIKFTPDGRSHHARREAHR
jgi:signal transduction histidine kinase